MKKSLLIIASAMMLFVTPLMAVASAGSSEPLHWANVDLNDKASLQRGAGLFANYCQGCHSIKFMRLNRVAKDLGIPEHLAKKHLMRGTDKIGDPITNTMPADKAADWFGVAPPDLSLTSRVRGDDWIYSYLIGFYQDGGTPTGWNNKYFPNVAMPNVLAGLQGVQQMKSVDGHDADGNHKLELISAGSMDEDEFSQAAHDITNYLSYVGEPAKMVRAKYGTYTLIFLALFFMLAYFLKKEFWRDVH